jgi:hypothetical protein
MPEVMEVISILCLLTIPAGFNGSYFLSAGFGLREWGGRLNFNLREGNINFYGNYSLNTINTNQYCIYPVYAVRKSG